MDASTDPRGGATIAAGDDPLSAPAVALAMRPAARARVALQVVESAVSTNTDLMAAAPSLPGGTVLAAEVQTGGRGRRGRTWHAERGASLTFSILWSFARSTGGLGGLSLAVGLAVARALERCGARGVQLKWPNDLVARAPAGWAKLCGILIEVAASGDGAAAVVGIGLNVRPHAEPAHIGQPITDAASLGARLPRNLLLAALLEELVDTLAAFDADGLAPFAAAWQARHAFAGQLVTIAGDAGNGITGIAAGIDGDGALVIETASGRERVIAGDVSLRAAP